MSFFKNLFGLGTGDDKPLPGAAAGPNVKFGRFSDSFKLSEQVRYWQTSNEHFEKKDYVQAYSHFLQYLGDSRLNNRPAPCRRREGSL